VPIGAARPFVIVFDRRNYGLSAHLPAVFLAQDASQNPLQVVSPDGQIAFMLSQSSAGQPGLHYSVVYGKPLINEPELGLEFQGQPALGPAMHNVGAKPGSTDDHYTIPVGKTKEVRARKSAWDWCAADPSTGVDFTPAMNTATLKHYIDFASGFPYMLIDAGWALAPHPDAHPSHTSFSKRPVNRSTVLDIHMVSGGGNAIWLRPEGAKP
jgi:hypothetical protein